MHTKETVLAKIGTGENVKGDVVEKILYTLWIGQTEDEQQHADVKYLNRRGFSVATRKAGTFIGRCLQRAVDEANGDLKRVPWGTIMYARNWQVKALEIARHHAAQVANTWNDMNARKAA